ncbi:AlpA family transcriptional regulator [Methylotenera sp.]|uniref:helix-turn-helix transcriptional regulator n=1 Tax=Methylotenera sp. TaxID=2051956 RepID=UPI0027307309|nr:AlpA family phage regulatory protein [Methylotenera sp.]MDP1523303.1 AlpA family phage regulatory protein [Methylotenera sp.]MDP2071685.1 AlpA family phage regulatory protein [Methylotenera sp.]MDP2231765.1 AlpA family phage regulatory protein [Methylotenera sp.]MDP3006775.1 AlpA family phage regulatory protein [Methylotenera sp.]
MDKKNSNAIKFYRVKQLAELLNVSKSSIWGWVKLGSFPQPIKLATNVTAWREVDICNWLNSKERLS